jgi:two-component sensor histidine kinase
MDIAFDDKAPSIVVTIPHYREGYIDILNRGGKIRCITEVTPRNIHDCKDLLKLVTELRHLDGMKGGIAINESEYMATTILKEEKPLTEVIYSNAEEMVSQGQYIFDTLWNNAIPAIKKIKEIEEGKPIEYTTQILSKSSGSLDESKLGEHLRKSKEIDMVTSTPGLSMSYDFFKTMAMPKQTEKRVYNQKYIKILVEVSKENLEVVKKYLDLDVEIRHLKKEPPIYFAVTNLDMMATIERMEYRNITESILYSNDPAYINHFKSVFERMWSDSKSAEEIVALIQNDAEVPIIETIESSDKTIRLIKDLISEANTEILGLLPSFKAFQRQVDAGMFEHIRKVSQQKKLAIRLLVTDKIESASSKPVIEIGHGRYPFLIRARDNENQGGSVKVYEFTADNIENMTVRSIINENVRPQMGIVVVDKCKSIVVEPKESQSENALDYVGISSYSNSSHISKSYVTIFDTLWNYAEMLNLFEKSNEQLKKNDMMQREFIDIVAHELRTPLQSILGLTDIAKTRTTENEVKDLLETVSESGIRLQKFIENILTTTKLEGLLGNDQREIFDLNIIIRDIVGDYHTRLQKMMRSSSSSSSSKPSVKDIDFDLHGFKQVHMVKANKLQISMVVSNLIDNAINFIPLKQKGLISITIEKENSVVIVKVKDNGEGIHPDILPRLFTKFATKSFYGSGLGLYTCKKIIHMHYGEICAQNNSQDERGATISFSLPLIS